MRAAVVAGFAVGGPVHREAGAVAQGGGKIVGKPDFVFDEQDAHGRFSYAIIVAARLNEAEATCGGAGVLWQRISPLDALVLSLRLQSNRRN